MHEACIPCILHTRMHTNHLFIYHIALVEAGVRYRLLTISCNRRSSKSINCLLATP